VSLARWRLAAAALVAGCVVLGYFAASRALWYETADFFCFWSAGRVVASGGDPYDTGVWAEVTKGLHPDPSGALLASVCPGGFGYPLWTALAFVPVGLLPLPVAATVWAGLSFLAAAIGALAAWLASGGGRRGLPVFAAIVVTAQPLWVLAVGGQLSGVMLGLVGLSALGIARGADSRAGAAFALLALKPQLVGLYGPALFVRAAISRPRFAVAASAAFGAMLIATFAIAPSWPLDWLGQVSGGWAWLGRTSLLATAWGLSADLFGTVALAPVLVLALVAFAYLLARRQGGLLAFAAIALPISVFASPYAWSYDQLVLVFPWAVTLAVAFRSAAPRRPVLMIATAAVASALPWALYAIAFQRGVETLNALVPAFTALLVAAALGGERGEVARSGP
jgi:hypothetical protein